VFNVILQSYLILHLINCTILQAIACCDHLIVVILLLLFPLLPTADDQYADFVPFSFHTDNLFLTLFLKTYQLFFP